MDKFGIFKLLNSFFDFYQNSKQPSDKNPPENSAAESKPISFSANESSSGEDVGVNGKNIDKNKTKPALLQMLNTINTHDKFVERVIGKNKK